MVSFTKLSTLAECAKRYYYSYELGLEGPPEEKIALLAGSAGHKGLQVLYETSNLDTAQEAVETEWDQLGALSSEYLCAGWLQQCVRNYHEDIYTSEPFETIAVEVEVKRWIGKQNIDLHVIIDRVVRNPITNLNYIVDYKFTRAWVTEYWAKRYSFDLSHQFRLYTLAVEAERDIQISGAYVYGIHMGKGAADSEDAWKKRSSSRVVLFGPYSWPRPLLEESLEWALDLDQEIEWRQDSGVYPQNMHNRYGCPSCDFYQLCASSPRVREGLIRGYARKVER